MEKEKIGFADVIMTHLHNNGLADGLGYLADEEGEPLNNDQLKRLKDEEGVIILMAGGLYQGEIILLGNGRFLDQTTFNMARGTCPDGGGY